MKCLALQHVCFEDLGVFAPILADFGYSIEYRQAGSAPISILEWIEADLIIALGGPIGVYEEDRYPWLTQEIEGLRFRLTHKAPTIGICLGAQLIAAALGSRVYPAAEKEIGWEPLNLSIFGKRSCLSHLQNVEVLHWHGDTFDLPAGAELLASTARTPFQAFSLGDFALACQFHPEIDGSNIERWLIGHTCELGHARISVQELRSQTESKARFSAKAGQAMLANWLSLRGSRSAERFR